MSLFKYIHKVFGRQYKEHTNRELNINACNKKLQGNVYRNLLLNQAVCSSYYSLEIRPKTQRQHRNSDLYILHVKKFCVVKQDYTTST